MNAHTVHLRRSGRSTQKHVAMMRGLITGLGAATLILGTACAGVGEVAEPDQSQGHSLLKFGISDEPAQLTAGMNQGTVANTMLTLIHRGLMTYDSEGGLINALAQTVDTPDPLTYDFTLHDDLVFHDGTPLTADNVKNSLEYYASEDVGASIYVPMSDIESIEVVDDTRVIVTLSAPNSSFLGYLATPMAAIIPDESLNAEGKNWVGAGPFQLEGIDTGIGLTLDKFEGFYDAESVALDEIDVTFYVDGEARTNALLSGQVDFIDYVPWENFDRISESEGMTLDAQSGPWHYVLFNVEEGPFADPKVRQAVAHVIDRDNSVIAGFLGHGESITGPPLNAQDPAFPDGVPVLWETDLDKARQLMSESQYPDGFEATFLTTSQYMFQQDITLSIQADLAEIGIDITLDAPDWATRVTQGNNGEYDLSLQGSTGMVSDPSYLSQYVDGPPSYSRSFGYNNDALNQLLEQGLRATSDEEKSAAYLGALEMIQTDVPFAAVSTRDQAYAYNSNVEGFKNLPGFLTFYSGYSFVDVKMTQNE